MLNIFDENGFAISPDSIPVNAVVHLDNNLLSTLVKTAENPPLKCSGTITAEHVFKNKFDEISSANNHLNQKINVFDLPTNSPEEVDFKTFLLNSLNNDFFLDVKFALLEASKTPKKENETTNDLFKIKFQNDFNIPKMQSYMDICSSNLFYFVTGPKIVFHGEPINFEVSCAFIQRSNMKSFVNKVRQTDIEKYQIACYLSTLKTSLLLKGARQISNINHPAKVTPSSVFDTFINWMISTHKRIFLLEIAAFLLTLENLNTTASPKPDIPIKEHCFSTTQPANTVLAAIRNSTWDLLHFRSIQIMNPDTIFYFATNDQGLANLIKFYSKLKLAKSKNDLKIAISSLNFKANPNWQKEIDQIFQTFSSINMAHQINSNHLPYKICQYLLATKTILRRNTAKMETEL